MPFFTNNGLEMNVEI